MFASINSKLCCLFCPRQKTPQLPGSSSSQISISLVASRVLVKSSGNVPLKKRLCLVSYSHYLVNSGHLHISGETQSLKPWRGTLHPVWFAWGVATITPKERTRTGQSEGGGKVESNRHSSHCKCGHFFLQQTLLLLVDCTLNSTGRTLKRRRAWVSSTRGGFL